MILRGCRETTSGSPPSCPAFSFKSPFSRSAASSVRVHTVGKAQLMGSAVHSIEVGDRTAAPALPLHWFSVTLRCFSTLHFLSVLTNTRTRVSQASDRPRAPSGVITCVLGGWAGCFTSPHLCALRSRMRTTAQGCWDCPDMIKFTPDTRHQSSPLVGFLGL